jgi:GNAT superfamily N-acetyltransferase
VNPGGSAPALDHPIAVAAFAQNDRLGGLDGAQRGVRRRQHADGGRSQPKHLPDPVPIAVLGRLAVERAYQKHGLGRALMQDASKRVLHAADIIGIRGIVIHAISEDAKAFYLAPGFDASPLQPLTLMATLADLKATI